MGHTHSCHHPTTHKINESEIKRNPSALHNTRFKKRIRKEMLEGGRPEECHYCWDVEDASPQFSDRVFKSAESWSLPHMQEIKDLGWRGDYNPKYVEVAFSNACNFKCSYCGPSFSSAWMQEIKTEGAYPTLGKFNDLDGLIAEGKVPILHTEENPYVEAFWKWWPDLYRDLHTFRITGGEPLMSKDTWGVLDYIINEPNPNKKLRLAINSNLGIPDKLVDRLIEKIQAIEEKELVEEFIIFTSVDGYGEQAEYIRNGLNWEQFDKNVNKILSSCKRISITVMSTFNALSVPSYKKLIDYIYALKMKYTSSDRYWNSAVFLDTSYLRYPKHQTVKVLPEEWAIKIKDAASHMDYLGIPKFEHVHVGYSDVEIQKVKRTYDWMLTDRNEEELLKQRRDFGVFFKEHDRRRETNFKEVYPELADFYEHTQTIKL
jgi:sulfatase maturation enzyme AslB (radical SAM superfamily)